MSGRPFFSVVTPTKDRPELLERAVESVRRQSFEGYEIVVVDDGSAAPLPERLATRIEEKGRIVRLASSGGPSTARNRGLDVAAGEWIVFLDDDDELSEGALAAFARGTAQAEDDVVWLGGAAHITRYRGDETRRRTLSWAEGLAGRDVAYRKLLSSPDTVMVFSGVAARASVAKEVRFDETLRSAVDREFLLRLSRRGSLLAVPEEVIRVHTHEGPKVNVYSRAKAKAYEQMLAVNAAAFRTMPKSRAAFERKAGWLFGMAGHPSEARTYLSRSLLSWPFDAKTWAIAGVYALPLGVGRELHKRASALRHRLRR